MTEVAAAGAHGHQLADQRRAGSAPRGDHRFAAMLLGGERAGDQRPFGGGTMPSRVEAFGAHGLFDGSAPIATLAATGAVDAGRMVRVRPEPTVQVDADPSGELAAISATMETPACAVRSAGLALEPVAAQPSPETAPPAPDTRSGGQPIAIGPIGVDEAPEPVTAVRTPMPRARARDATASLKVSLATDETGVAVSVIGDVRDAKLPQAVARLLARYGRVLSGLRVTRNGSADGRQQGTS